MTKTRDSILPRSKLNVRMPPGAATPRSGIYEQVGPRGGRTGDQITSAKGKPLPPTKESGQKWTLVIPTNRTGEKAGK
jgi:hypothetical protein